MAGYDGYSMSNNARQAYFNGEKPLSKWTKYEILSSIQNEIVSENLEINFNLCDLKKLTKDNLTKEFLTYTSYHHTSKVYNVTEFYSIDTCAILDFSQEKLEKLLELQKKEKADRKIEKKEKKRKFWHVKYAVWERSGRRTKFIFYEADGYVEGDWFYVVESNDFSKKKNIYGKHFYLLYELDKDEIDKLKKIYPHKIK